MDALVKNLWGEAAEQSVARLYEGRGHAIAARRWRGRGGEIDLITRDGAQVIFVEVKAAATHDQALQRLRPAQIRRIRQTVAEFLAGEPQGALTEVRFDLALVDRQGQVAICPNILAA